MCWLWVEGLGIGKFWTIIQNPNFIDLAKPSVNICILDLNARWFFHWFWGFSPIWPSSTSITPSVLSQPKPPIYHSIIWIFPLSLIDHRWSTCAGPEIHFSFSFFHSFLTLIHTSLSRRFWLFLSSSCILPHARFMMVWRLIRTLTGHWTF